MTIADAAKLLDVPADASPEQLQARFHELRTRLEEKIGKAPTPGLKAKYRESLAEITTAFETLTLAADSSSLPVASKQSAVSSQQSASVAGPAGNLEPQASHLKPAVARKSGGKEFALVAIIAVVVLAAGGWFVMKTRAENAEKARIAAEMKAEADRKAEESRVAAEAKKKAEEEEKIRVAAAAKTEGERLDKLGAQVRIILAEAKLQWEQIEKQERDAERELSELKQELKTEQSRVATNERNNQSQSKSVETAQADYEQKYQQHNDKLVSLQRRAEQAEARRDPAAMEQAYEDIRQEESNWKNFERQNNAAQAARDRQSQSDSAGDRRNELTARITAHSEYVQWLSDFIATHPVKSTQVRATEFLNSRLINEASQTAATLHDLLASAKQEIATRKPKEDDLYGSVVIMTDPAGIPWKLTDAFGNIMSGKTPGTAARVAAGPATVYLQRQDWEESQLTVSVTAGKATRAEFAYRPASLQFTSGPSGAEVLLDGKSAGRTPLTVANLPHRSYSIEIRLSNYKPWTGNVKLAPGEKRDLEVFLNTLTDKEFIAQCSTRWSGTWSGTLRGILFYCKFVAGGTRYVQWNGSGKYANNPPSQIDLVLVSRAPLVLDQLLKFPEGRVGLDGSTGMKVGRLKEQDGQLIYVGLSPDGRNMGEVVLQRTDESVSTPEIQTRAVPRERR